MAISPLGIDQIVAVIRQQMADPVRTQTSAPISAATPAAAPRVGRNKGGARPQSGNAKQSGLGKLIMHRIGALKDEAPERGRKAFRIFLESVLMNELGENLINDPCFSQLVEDVQLQMEQDPGIASAMRDAIGQLLTGVDPAVGAAR